MVTVTPSSANQFVVAVRAGLQETDVKVNEAWNLKDVFNDVSKDLPDEWIIRSVAGKDHALAAQYFIEMMDFFLKK